MPISRSLARMQQTLLPVSSLSINHTLTSMTRKQLLVFAHHRVIDFCCSIFFRRAEFLDLGFCKPTLFFSRASIFSLRHLCNHKSPGSLHWCEHWLALCLNHQLKNQRQAMQWRLLAPFLQLLLAEGKHRQLISLICLPSILLIVYYKQPVYKSSLDNQFKVRLQSIMELNYMNNLKSNLGGFDYENCLRNKALEANLPADKKLKFTKTGTTICGVVFKVSDKAK